MKEISGSEMLTISQEFEQIKIIVIRCNPVTKYSSTRKDFRETMAKFLTLVVEKRGNWEELETWRIFEGDPYTERKI